jgi:hypothetical protein
MNEYLDAVREQIGAGRVSAESLVLLFHATSEAEQRDDVPALQEALALAREITRTAEEKLRDEGERLVALCEQSLARVQTPSRSDEPRSAAGPVSTCPECGRELPVNAVRCRACGFLLV